MFVLSSREESVNRTFVQKQKQLRPQASQCLMKHVVFHTETERRSGCSGSRSPLLPTGFCGLSSVEVFCCGLPSSSRWHKEHETWIQTLNEDLLLLCLESGCRFQFRVCSLFQMFPADGPWVVLEIVDLTWGDHRDIPFYQLNMLIYQKSKQDNKISKFQQLRLSVRLRPKTLKRDDMRPETTCSPVRRVFWSHSSSISHMRWSLWMLMR